MAKKYTQVTEDLLDTIFDSSLTAAELQQRKISLARVLSEAESAVTLATNQGKKELAVKLQDRVDLLQELLARADELAPTSSDIDIDKPGLDDSSASTGRGGDNDAGDDENDGAKSKEEKPDDTVEAEPEDKANNPDKDSSTDPKKPTSDTSKSSNTDEPEDEDITEPDAEEQPDDSESNDNNEPEESGNSADSEASDETDEPSTSGEAEKSDNTKDPDDSEEDAKSENSDEPSDIGDTGTPDTEDITDSGEDSSTSDKIYKDPFRRSPPGKMPDGPEPENVESTLDAAKRILSKLDGEARKGAVQGLKDLMAKRGITIRESLYKSALQEKVDKVISQMSNTEFNDLLASTMDLVNKVKPVSWSDDLEVRAKEIKADSDNAIKRAELEREDAEHVKADRAAARASERERERYAKVKGLPGLDAFKRNLYKAIKDQVDISDDEVDSWAALDRRHEDDPSIVKKGFIRDGDELIPTVHVYFDQSGSWSNEDVEIGKRAVSVINEFHNRGEIDLKIFYMSAAGVTTNAEAARADGRAEGWHAALQHIKGSKVKNVVILSDSDLDDYERWNRPTGNNGVTRVDGCVWWLWKNSSVSNKALKELRGRRGSFQYMFVGARYY